MKKSNGVIRLLLCFVVMGFVLFTAIVGWEENKSGSIYDIKLGLDLAGGVSITYEAVTENPSAQDMEDTKYRIQKRVESFSTEAEVYMEGSNRIVVDIPGETDANAVLEELGKPGTLYFCVKSEYAEELADAGIETKEVTWTDSYYGKMTGLQIMDGNLIKNASGGMYEGTSGYEYVVNLVFTSEAQKIFSTVTSLLVEDKGIIYVVYDGKTVSSPIVQSAITADSCQISNITDLETAQSLATTIRIGALPVELEEIRSTVVGAKLGSDAVQSSLIAGAIGLLIVLILMVVLYRGMGLAADFALILYTGLIIMLLSAYQITLTLPGIAGIILGIGMAVDANVIIFARIREEIGAGKTVLSSIKTGFSKAMSAIIDGNITTLISAGVLYLLGSGTVRGFAQTLALGIVVSMFTALFVTKVVLYSLYMLGMQNEKFYGKTVEVKTINFLGKKKLFAGIAGAVIAVGVIAMIVFGVKDSAFNYSLEFQGGTSFNITFDKTYTIDELDSDVIPILADAAGISTTDIQPSPVQGTTEVILKTKELSQEQRAAFYEALESEFGILEEDVTTENISATVSSEMKQDAIVAVVIATILMLIYIWFRFKNVSFAISAVSALVHDVLVTITCYALFRWSVGNTFIACMLTIVGYSVNATIVIFDRIRENLKEMAEQQNMKNLRNKMTLEDIVNGAISQTLTRTIYTSLTTVVMVVVLFILGVTAIREFALPLIVGIVCGTYSSICLTGALWYTLRKREIKKEEAAAAAEAAKKAAEMAAMKKKR